MSARGESSWDVTREAMVLAIESGRLSSKQVIEEFGIEAGTLGGWIRAERHRRERQSNGSQTFVRVEVPGAGSGTVADVVLRGGRRLRVRAGFDADELVRLVRVLETC
jgi:hypothetical protein